MEILTTLSNILPTPPTGTPAELAEKGLEFFGLWISRIGGLVAFVGAIKFALSLKSDDSKEQLLAILTMVSGFMIRAAIIDLSIFDIPASYTVAAANAEFRAIMNFIGNWTRRVGAIGAFIGAVMFGFATKDNNSVSKLAALKTFIAGAVITAVSAALPTFV
jgi:hypothetical protein